MPEAAPVVAPGSTGAWADAAAGRASSNMRPTVRARTCATTPGEARRCARMPNASATEGSPPAPIGQDPTLMPAPNHPWERPLGAHPVAPGRTAFRVWAPRAERIALELDGREHALDDAGLGVFETEAAASAGARYRFVVDGTPLPDPASRSQPDGLRGASAVVDPATFEWSDATWHPPVLHDLVLYELHVGTFTPEGTFEAAVGHLGALRELGVTGIELMPVAEFPGRHGWGYDGVYLSAAHSAYGGPHGLARLIDAAHA